MSGNINNLFVSIFLDNEGSDDMWVFTFDISLVIKLLASICRLRESDALFFNFSVDGTILFDSINRLKDDVSTMGGFCIELNVVIDFDIGISGSLIGSYGYAIGLTCIFIGPVTYVFGFSWIWIGSFGYTLGITCI